MPKDSSSSSSPLHSDQCLFLNCPFSLHLSSPSKQLHPPLDEQEIHKTLLQDSSSSYSISHQSLLARHQSLHPHGSNPAQTGLKPRHRSLLDDIFQLRNQWALHNHLPRPPDLRQRVTMVELKIKSAMDS